MRDSAVIIVLCGRAECSTDAIQQLNRRGRGTIGTTWPVGGLTKLHRRRDAVSILSSAFLPF
jgi:hypothetical protein